MRRRLRWFGAGVLGLVLVMSIVMTLATALLKLPGEETVPAGIRRSSSRYLKMRDGVAIAVSVYLPSELKAGERVPVLMRTTRYWREPQIGRALRLLVVLHLASPEDLFDKQVAFFNQRRFAVLLMDARGSGASGGTRGDSEAACDTGGHAALRHV
ncbi:MAG TPA: CocE/NonD family hydrolase [Candidatus Acidoferrum sp.]|nr:CocE/NonD family hydrolase [Candidatus Acidoferrum sp.]